MIRSLLAAVAFLTRIPVPASVHTDEASLRRSASWFPIVGLLLGCMYAAVAWVAAPHLPALVLVVLLLVMDALLTGALHLDGLADMADGFGGGRTREDVLRIMREHAIGSYGGTALALLLMLKAACLSDLVMRPHALGVIVAAPALARWSIVFLSRLAPYARRPGDGAVTGSGALSQSISGVDLIIATAQCAVLPFIVGLKPILACWLSVAMVTVLIAWLCSRRIGGVTGDTLGANVVVSEAVQFAVAIVVLPTR